MSRTITGGRAARRLMTLLVGLGLGASALVVSGGPTSIVAGDWDPGAAPVTALTANVNDGNYPGQNPGWSDWQ